MIIYMEITRDEYEFPIHIADSASELGKLCGVSRNCILSCVSKSKKGKIGKSRYVKVEVPDDEEEEDLWEA